MNYNLLLKEPAEVIIYSNWYMCIQCISKCRWDMVMMYLRTVYKQLLSLLHMIHSEI